VRLELEALINFEPIAVLRSNTSPSYSYSFSGQRKENTENAACVAQKKA
jgi:hypothetical protein